MKRHLTFKLTLKQIFGALLYPGWPTNALLLDNACTELQCLDTEQDVLGQAFRLLKVTRRFQSHMPTSMFSSNPRQWVLPLGQLL